MSTPAGVRAATVMTHGRPAETVAALESLVGAAQAAGVQLRLDEQETAKHGDVLGSRPGVVANAPIDRDVELCFALGGDGTILRALRTYAGSRVPVFAVNFGHIGFLATLEADELGDDGFARAFARDFELLALPAIEIETGGAAELAINDISIHRRMGDRVAELAYSLNGDEVGRVRSDGVVVATPAGSTGYNLANGGPVMAWGVEGYVVSFIAPHSLTARALVVAPSDVLTVHNRSHASVDVTVDGRPVGAIEPGEAMQARFSDGAGLLAQLHGFSFYRRLREKFGRLSR